MRRASLTALVVLAALLGCCLSGTAAAKRPIAGATIKPNLAGPKVPKSFMGGSLDYKWLPLYAGLSSGLGPEYGPNRLTAALFRNLTPAGGRPPVLRVGSGGADNIWWNPERRPYPPGIYSDLQPIVLQGLKEFQAVSGMPLMVGLNLALNQPKEAARMARAVLTYLPTSTLFELGNEPDLYSERPWKDNPRGGPQLPPRRAPYRFGRYLREFGRHIRELRRLRPRPRLAGPAAGLGSGDAWLTGLPKFLKRFHRPVRAATYHGYPLSACSPKNAPDHPTIRNLLSFVTIARYVTRFAPLAAQAGRWGRPLILSESGSAACGGAPGVSDSFASALWGVDWLLRMQLVGVDGVYFQMAGPYSPFNITTRVGEPPAARVLPLYYAMLMVAKATAGSSRSVWARPDFRLFLKTRANVQPMAFRTRREIRVVVLNKDLRKSGRVRIRVLGAKRNGRLARLKAPGVRSTSGVTFAGQSLDATTTDGVLHGEYRDEAVRRRGRGYYTFRMPKASAALLTIPRGR